MAEGRPRLVAVPESSADAGPRAPHGRARRRLPWLLAGLALLCAVGWALAQRESDRLGRELETTRVALSDARAGLQRVEAQRSAARTQLEGLASEASALAGRLSELRALLATDPLQASDAQPMRNEPPPAD